MTRQSVCMCRRFPQFNLELLGHDKCAKLNKKKYFIIYVIKLKPQRQNLLLIHNPKSRQQAQNTSVFALKLHHFNFMGPILTI